MIPHLRTLILGFFFSMTTVACFDSPDPDEERLARVEAKLDAIMARMDNIETRLDQAPLASITTSDLATAPPVPSPPPTLDLPAPSDGLLSANTGSLTSMGQPVFVSATDSVEDAVAFGAPVRIAGRVDGDAVSFGSDVVVDSTGMVTGDAVSFGGRVVVEPGGQVMGDRVGFSAANEQNAPASMGGASLYSITEGLRGRLSNYVRQAVIMLCVAGAGVLVVGLFPARVRNIAEAMERHPFRNSVAGITLVAAATLASILLTITLIGSPFAFGILLMVGICWLLGFVALCQATGDLLPVPHSFRGGLGAFLVGAILVTALAMVPVVGWLVLFLSLFVSVGATVATRFGAE